MFLWLFYISLSVFPSLFLLPFSVLELVDIPFSALALHCVRFFLFFRFFVS